MTKDGVMAALGERREGFALVSYGNAHVLRRLRVCPVWKRGSTFTIAKIGHSAEPCKGRPVAPCDILAVWTKLPTNKQVHAVANREMQS